MRILSRFPFLLLPFLLFFPALPAHAVGPGGDLYLGYSRLGSNAFYSNVSGLNGWEAAGHIHFVPFIGAELDVSRYGLGSSSGTPHTTTVLLGPRVTVGVSRIHLFVHGLVGMEHSANSGGSVSVSGSSLTVAAGGGVDYRIAPMFAWRVNADYISSPTQSPSTSSRSRFGTGLVFRF